MFKSEYLAGIYATVEKRNPGEPEFLQTVREVLESLEPVVAARPELEKKGIKCVEKAFTDSNDVTVVAAAAAAEADVIYIPTDNTAAECATTINGVIGNTPVIAGEENLCKGCGVATLSINYYDLGVATGKMAAKILKGEAKISEMEIAYADKFTKKYNVAKCQQLGIDTAKFESLGYVAIEEN